MRRPAEAFPPGEFLKEELEARGWTQSDLAAILGRPLGAVNQITTGRRRITATTARGLAEAFGTSAAYWMNLESAYQLSMVRSVSKDISRRARLYSMAPVTAMIRRGWIEPSSDIDVLEQRVLAFFEMQSLDEEPE